MIVSASLGSHQIPNIITTDGEVTRPPFVQGTTEVTLTATLSKGVVTHTKTFILTVIAIPGSDIEIVNREKEALAIVYTSPDTDERSVTENVTLPTSGADDVSISWTSSASGVITTTGTVNRPTFAQGDANVTLTATLSKGSATTNKTFILTVMALPDTDGPAVRNASNTLAIGYAAGDSENSVTENVTLPTSGADSVSISWTSSAPGVIAINGTVTRPTFAQGAANVTLTATLSKGAVTATKTFTLTVIALPDTDGPAVRNANNALVIGYTSPDTDSNSVTTNVTLPTSGADGVSISWTSSAPGVIAINGTVTRPTFAQGAANVTLTATLSKGAVTATKTFTLTVIAIPGSDMEIVNREKEALAIGYTSPDTDSNSVTENVTLPTSGAGGVSISWMSSAANFIATNGEVTRPDFSDGDTNVTLTATLSKGDVTATKVFTLTVIDHEFLAVYSHSSVVFDNKIWVMGGSINTFMFSTSLWSSVNGMDWTRVSNDTLVSPRHSHSSVVFQNKIWVIGGRTLNFRVLNDVWSSVNGNNWTQVTNNAPFSLRQSHSSVVFQDKIWVIGGYNTAVDQRLNDVWSSVDGTNWTQATSNTGFLIRSSHSSVVFDNKIWVMGGDFF